MLSPKLLQILRDWWRVSRPRPWFFPGKRPGHPITLTAAPLAEYERRGRARLDAELCAQTALRRLTQRMSDDDIEELFELARTDGIMPIVRRTASFNRHRELILTLFKHPPARQILFRHLVG